MVERDTLLSEVGCVKNYLVLFMYLFLAACYGERSGARA